MLTQSGIDDYRRNGYTVQSALLSVDDVAALLAELDRICAGNTLAAHDTEKMEMEPGQPPDGTAVRRVYEPSSHYPVFADLSRSATLLDCVEALIGPDIIRHYSKINMKPPAVGSVVEWHQDLSYYPLTNGDSLAVLVYLDDTTIDNGCLQVIPGVHEQPLMDHTKDGFFEGRITQAVDETRAAPIEGAAGTAIFMHAMTPHASTANTSRKPRRTLIISYRAADAYPVYRGEETADAGRFEKLVRGTSSPEARFTFSRFPVPVTRGKIVSLYQLQERSRDETSAPESSEDGGES